MLTMYSFGSPQFFQKRKPLKVCQWLDDYEESWNFYEYTQPRIDPDLGDSA